MSGAAIFMTPTTTKTLQREIPRDPPRERDEPRVEAHGAIVLNSAAALPGVR
jgi:hypothetical protein